MKNNKNFASFLVLQNKLNFERFCFVLGFVLGFAKQKRAK
jgi:hypothetical protein